MRRQTERDEAESGGEPETRAIEETFVYATGEHQITQVRQGEQHPGDRPRGIRHPLLDQRDQVRERDDRREDEGELEEVEQPQCPQRWRRLRGQVLMLFNDGLVRLGQQHQQYGGRQRKHGHDQVLAMRRDPRTQRADQNRRDDQGGSGTALHHRERLRQLVAGQRRSQITVASGKRSAEETLQDERQRERRQTVREACAPGRRSTVRVAPVAASACVRSDRPAGPRTAHRSR